MTDLTSLTIAQARDKLLAKECSALELTDAYLGAAPVASGTAADGPPDRAAENKVINRGSST